MRNGLLIGILILIATNLAFAQKKEIKKIKKSYNTYKDAILNDKSELAIQCIDKRTIAYYDSLLVWVKTADSAKLETYSFFDKFMVLIVRGRIEPEKIKTFTGTTLLAEAIERGMVGKTSVANTEIGSIIVEKDFAKTRFIADGVEAPVDVHFYKTNKVWKIDLTSMFPLTQLVLTEMAKENGQTENEFILTILEYLAGQKPNASIWQPTK